RLKLGAFQWPHTTPARHALFRCEITHGLLRTSLEGPAQRGSGRASRPRPGEPGSRNQCRAPQSHRAWVPALDTISGSSARTVSTYALWPQSGPNGGMVPRSHSGYSVAISSSVHRRTMPISSCTLDIGALSHVDANGNRWRRMTPPESWRVLPTGTFRLSRRPALMTQHSAFAAGLARFFFRPLMRGVLGVS